MQTLLPACVCMDLQYCRGILRLFSHWWIDTAHIWCLDCFRGKMGARLLGLLIGC